MGKIIKILSETFEIKEKENIKDFEFLLGEINHINNEIYICSKISNSRKKVTLIHEILHSIFEQLGFDEEHDNEQLIKTLSTSLYQVLEDNKELFSFL